MATRAPVRPQAEQVRHDRRPSTAELRERARDAAREGQSIDYGSLSRAERHKLLAERFGI